MAYVPLEKQSKKAQKAFHARQRGSWNGINPISRKAPNRKAYDRNRAKTADRRESMHSGICLRGKSRCFCLHFSKFPLCYLPKCVV